MREFNVIAPDENQQKTAQQALNIVRDAKIGELAADSKNLPPNLEQLNKEIDLALQERFNRLGIKWNPLPSSEIFLVKRKNGETKGGEANPLGTIVINDIILLDEGQPGGSLLNLLIQYNQARTLVHEKYHEAGSTRYTLDKGNKVRAEKSGLEYTDKRFQTGFAVEEGLAVLTEYSMTVELVDKSFPGSEVFYSLLVNKLQADPAFANKVKAGELPIESVVINSDEKGNIELFISYPQSIRLVKYLMKKVPNFVQLAEAARVEHKTLALARALKQAFPGVKSNVFRLVMQATEKTAATTMAILTSSS